MSVGKRGEERKCVGAGGGAGRADKAAKEDRSGVERRGWHVECPENKKGEKEWRAGRLVNDGEGGGWERRNGERADKEMPEKEEAGRGEMKSGPIRKCRNMRRLGEKRWRAGR